MATYFLRSNHISRGKGSRVTRAAAYRAGERILDERTSEVFDHSARRDVAYKEIVLPADLAGRPDMAWTQDRSTLWNAAEHAGLRRNSRLAREWLVLVPPELTPAQRTRLVRNFANELAEKYRCAVDACLHEPRPGADPRNHHAHLLMTTRQVTPDGFGARTSLELGGRERRLAGLGGSSEAEYLGLRERWAQLINESLREAGLTARVDHRSLERQGVNREPVPNIPEKVFYAERKRGGPTAAGDEIRSRHRERVEARRSTGQERTRVVERQKEQLRERAVRELNERDAQPKRIPWGALTRDERNAHRRKLYGARRALEKSDPSLEAQRRETRRMEARRRQELNPESVRATRRRWRHAHADEVNRKQREYRQARAALGRATSPATTAELSARNWKAYRDRRSPGPGAEESARRWLEFREREVSAGPASSPAEEQRRTPAAPQPAEPAPGHGPDFGL